MGIVLYSRSEVAVGLLVRAALILVLILSFFVIFSSPLFLSVLEFPSISSIGAASRYIRLLSTFSQGARFHPVSVDMSR